MIVEKLFHMASEKDRGKSPGECLHNGLYRCLPAANPEKCKDKSFDFRDQKKRVSYSHFVRLKDVLPCLSKPAGDSTFAPSGSVSIHSKTGSPKQAAVGAGNPVDL